MRAEKLLGIGSSLSEPPAPEQKRVDALVVSVSSGRRGIHARADVWAKNAAQHALSPERDRCAVQGDLSVGDRQRGHAGTGRNLRVAIRGQRCDGRCRGSADGRRAYGRRLRWGEEGAAHEGDGAKLLRATDCHCVLRRKKAATPAPRQTKKKAQGRVSCGIPVVLSGAFKMFPRCFRAGRLSVVVIVQVTPIALADPLQLRGTRSPTVSEKIGDAQK